LQNALPRVLAKTQTATRIARPGSTKLQVHVGIVDPGPVEHHSISIVLIRACILSVAASEPSAFVPAWLRWHIVNCWKDRATARNRSNVAPAVESFTLDYMRTDRIT